RAQSHRVRDRILHEHGPHLLGDRSLPSVRPGGRLDAHLRGHGRARLYVLLGQHRRRRPLARCVLLLDASPAALASALPPRAPRPPPLPEPDTLGRVRIPSGRGPDPGRDLPRDRVHAAHASPRPDAVPHLHDRPQRRRAPRLRDLAGWLRSPPVDAVASHPYPPRSPPPLREGELRALLQPLGRVDGDDAPRLRGDARQRHRATSCPGRARLHIGADDRGVSVGAGRLQASTDRALRVATFVTSITSDARPQATSPATNGAMTKCANAWKTVLPS